VSAIYECNMTVANRILLSPPAIAALLCRDRVTAWRHVDAGNFGPVIRRGRVTYVAQAEVERVAGVVFSENQIALAVGNVPKRRLTIPQMQEAE
jgi:hypothetical protein